MTEQTKLKIGRMIGRLVGAQHCARYFFDRDRVMGYCWYRTDGSGFRRSRSLIPPLRAMKSKRGLGGVNADAQPEAA